jgi:hypothetical protein
MGLKKDSDRSKVKRKVVLVFEQPLETNYVRQPRFHCIWNHVTVKKHWHTSQNSPSVLCHLTGQSVHHHSKSKYFVFVGYSMLTVSRLYSFRRQDD